MVGTRKRLGANAEALVADFLRASGYRIVAMNYRTRVGEIDVLARIGNELHIVEVKAGRAGGIDPLEQVTIRKQRKIAQLGRYLMTRNEFADLSIHFSVAGVTYSPSDVAIEWIPDAFGIDS